VNIDTRTRRPTRRLDIDMGTGAFSTKDERPRPRQARSSPASRASATGARDRLRLVAAGLQQGSPPGVAFRCSGSASTPRLIRSLRWRKRQTAPATPPFVFPVPEARRARRSPPFCGGSPGLPAVAHRVVRGYGRAGSPLGACHEQPHRLHARRDDVPGAHRSRPLRQHDDPREAAFLRPTKPRFDEPDRAAAPEAGLGRSGSSIPEFVPGSRT
jgi:hypothetical protein